MRPLSRCRFLFPILVFLILGGAGCRTIYYETMETLGTHKRDILLDRVDETRESQEEVKEQFQTTLERFSEVTGFGGADLRKAYDRFQAEFGGSEARAAEVSERIDAVVRVAEDLFGEWEEEMEDYTDSSLRRRSERQLRETRNRYDDLLATMRRAEARMKPVLDAFRDRVLFLKHNLNAQAIASLEGTTLELEEEIRLLIGEMNEAIREADLFIESMRVE